jgi:hypothetical protein
MFVKMREKGTVIQCWWKCKLVHPLWKKIWRLFKKLKIDLSYYQAVPLLGIYLKDCDLGYCKGTCTPMFVAALFTRAKLCKQPIYSTTDKQIKKMWYLCTIEFYLYTKKTEICYFQINGWNWRTSSYANLVRLRGQESCASLICRLQT